MTRRLFFLLLCILSISCKRKTPETHAQNKESQPQIKVEKAPSDTITLISNTPTPAITPTLTKPIKILFTGTFHGDEVEEGVAELPWLGLFTLEDETFVLRNTKLVANRVVDALLDDEENGEKTGWEIATENDEYPAMLISGGDFTTGNVEGGEAPATLFPGDSAEFEFKGIHYLLYATGHNQVDTLRGVNYVSDYSLHVVRTEKDKSLNTIVVSHASFDDAMTSILWSGDLDRDGYIDFLIDMSSHYNQRLPTLFLSKPAGDGKVVVRIAEHSSVGC